MRTASDRNWRVFYLGSRPDVVSNALNILRGDFPGIEIAGMSGFFNVQRDSPDNQAVLQTIASHRPHILLVGMGMPRQEYWIYENFTSIRANVILPAGAAIEYVAGTIPTPPRWAGRLGLEWIWRLVSEPRRLAGRYLIEPWTIFYILLVELFSGKITAQRKREAHVSE
jgi:N-acetylglucosaminyldiphosphoundecaprenol N-acetyl-beta-D-mannosaminyltransferase